MPTSITMTIKIGAKLSSLKKLPTVLTAGQPYITWSLPDGITQKRFNIKFNNPSTGAYYISGETVSSDSSFQFPTGATLNDSWNGLCHIEILISPIATIGKDFEYTSGESSTDPLQSFIYDLTAESIYNAESVTYNWNNVFDVDPGQIVSYHVQVATDPLFDVSDSPNITFDKTGIASSGAFYSQIVGTVLLQYTYFWRVRAFDGLNYGSWSVVHGFFTSTNYPPILKIVSVIPLKNEYGDVQIVFTTSDSSNLSTSVICTYTGGSVGTTSTACSMMTSTNNIPSGTHTVLWRSGNNEKQIKASDYAISMIAYNGNSFSLTDTYSPLTLDNSEIGIPSGGFGSVNVNFPLKGSFLLNSSFDFKEYTNPVIGAILTPVKYNYYGWDYSSDDPWGLDWLSLNPLTRGREPIPPNPKWYSVKTGSLVNYSLYSEGRALHPGKQVYDSELKDPNGNLVGSVQPQYTLAPDYTSAMPGTSQIISGMNTAYMGYNLPQSILWNYKQVINQNGDGYCYYLWGGAFPYATEDAGVAPLFTLAPSLYASNGYPLPVPASGWENLTLDEVYIRKYVIGYSFPETYKVGSVDYGYRNWAPVLVDGKWMRQSITNRGKFPTVITDPYGKQHIALDGQALDVVYENGVPSWTTPKTIDWTRLRPMQIGIPIYVKLSEAFYNPKGYSKDSLAKMTMSGVINGKYQYVLGTHVKDFASIWAWDTKLTRLGIQRDALEPKFTGRLVKKVYTTVKEDVSPFKGTFLASQGYFSNVAKYGAKNERYPNLDFRFTGTFGPKFELYFGGIPKSESAGYANRPDPPYHGDRGMVFKGTFKSPDNVEPLQFVYLQSVWDAYNTIHWQATMGYSTRAELQYSPYSSSGVASNWKDAITKGATFDTDLQVYLTPPMTWDVFFDTVNSAQFVEGQQYRFRLRLFDSVSKTFSQWVYSNPFEISHYAINPPNITSIEFDPWTKRLYIEFRLDDTQGDLYDIIGISYSSDGATWNSASISDLGGVKTSLASNTGGDVANPILHTIYWNTAPYDLSSGDNYRVRLFATLTSLTSGVDMPVFSWSIWNNPLIKQAEDTINAINGTTQHWYWSTSTAQWVYSSSPKIVPGSLQQIAWQIEDMKALPSPLGIRAFYQDHDVTKPLIDPTGYASWLATDIGGVTRGELLQSYAAQQETLNQQLQAAYLQRTEGEMLVRRGLIKQGFYNNGFINNDSSQTPFRFRVEALPYTGYIAQSAVYQTRFEVYYRLQLDFNSTYDSQVGSKPLRDILYDTSGNPLKAGKLSDNMMITYSTRYTPLPATTTVASTNTAAGSAIETDGTSGDVTPTVADYTTNPQEWNPQGSGTYSLPHTLLPGQVSNVKLNNSYPSQSDTLPSDQSSFETSYYWRVCAYNNIAGAAMEIARHLISNIKIANGTLSFDCSMMADEILQAVNLTGAYVSTASQTPAWENATVVVFPTDRPLDANGKFVYNEFYDNLWIPHNFQRSRPAVAIANHQYYMWTSKPGAYSQNIIMQSMGKSPATFGEYAQCFPFYPITKLSAYGIATLYYAPAICHDGATWHLWCNGLVNNANQIFYTNSDSTFQDWEQVTMCNGLAGCYYPTVIKEASVWKMWICKAVGGISQVFHFTSTDQITWTSQNGGNSVYTLSGQNVNAPCVIKAGNQYVMYFTEYYASGTRISSVSSSDGLNWSGYHIEIDGTNVSNPCVVLDNYMGNSVRRIYYNRQVSTTNVTIETAILNDRVWVAIDVKQVQGTKTNVPCSIQGMTSSYSAVLSNIGLSGYSGDLQVRVDFTNPSVTRNFMVMGDWIDYVAASQYDGSLTPDNQFRYKTVLLELDYAGSGT